MASSHQRFSEKRDYYRMMVNTEVKITVPGSDSTCTGRAKDLSATGIQFETECHLKVGQMVQILVEPVGRSHDALRADLQIKRVDVSSGRKFIVAGYLTNVR
jgi:hypothetical protein